MILKAASSKANNRLLGKLYALDERTNPYTAK